MHTWKTLVRYKNILSNPVELLERRAKKNVRSHRTNHSWILQNISLISTKWKCVLTVQPVASNSSVRFVNKLCNHIKGQIRFIWDDIILQIWSVVIQCCFVSNGNGFQNTHLLEKIQSSPALRATLVQHKLRLWSLRNTVAFDRVDIHGLNMADRAAFHQEIQSPGWLSDSKK